jgi:hypothetical protein
MKKIKKRKSVNNPFFVVVPFLAGDFPDCCCADHDNEYRPE